MNIAWIAGFFDGEGCVYIFPNGKGIQVSITQKNKASLELIKAFYGFGRIAYKDKNNQCHIWQVCSKIDILRFLRSIRQYVIVKKIDVEIGIIYAQTLDSKRHGYYRLDEQILNKRISLRKSLRCGERYQGKGE